MRGHKSLFSKFDNLRKGKTRLENEHANNMNSIYCA